MFTGLVEQQGEVIANIEGTVANRLLIRGDFKQLVVGESIAVNGVCLTLLPEHEQGLMFDVSPETLQLTTLGKLRPGDHVNLERGMLATTRFGGHYVSGHVDATASVQSITLVDEFVEMVIGDFPLNTNQYMLPKGSITLQGVSLTINRVNDESINVMLVPHTLANTTLGQCCIGDRLNVEFDYIARIVAHQYYSLRLK